MVSSISTFRNYQHLELIYNGENTNTVYLEHPLNKSMVERILVLFKLMVHTKPIKIKTYTYLCVVVSQTLVLSLGQIGSEGNMKRLFKLILAFEGCKLFKIHKTFPFLLEIRQQ